MSATEILERNIMQALKKAGLKRLHAANQLGISPSYFNHMIRTSKWQIRHLEALANLIQIPLWQLFYDGPALANRPEEVEQALVVLPKGERQPALDMDEYIKVPLVKLQVETETRTSGALQKGLGDIYVKKTVVGDISAGMQPCAVELKVRVR